MQEMVACFCLRLFSLNTCLKREPLAQCLQINRTAGSEKSGLVGAVPQGLYLGKEELGKFASRKSDL